KEFVLLGLRLFPPGSAGPAAAGQGVLADALAGGYGAFQRAGAPSELGEGLTSQGGADERDACAGRSPPAPAHALVDAARAHGDWRQAARRSAGRCATSRTTRLAGDLAFGRLDRTDHGCARQALALW